MKTTLPAPDLSDEMILRFVCGVRPCRKGGLRLEQDEVAHKPIVHNYGHGGCGVTLGPGCAEEVVRLVSEAVKPGDSVAVLGGGVTGLTSALALLRAGYRVRVHAETYALDTVSNIAGALWLPTGIDFPEPGPARDRFNALLRRSHAFFKVMDNARWGVNEYDVYEPIHTEDHPEFFESGAIKPPRPMSADDPDVPGLGEGRVFRTLFIDTPQFLGELVSEIERLGGERVTRKFESLDEVTSLGESLIVNCMAMGSQRLFGDDAMYPARGLLVHMQPQELGYIYHDGYRYMFPRQGALVLGGCFEPGETEPPEDDTPFRQILERHRARFS
ncbi:MAG: FAD-dependent oxidoreductase [Phycisphaerales bacterium JB058]